MSSAFFELGLIVVLVLLNGIFSATEIALVSLREGQVNALASRGARGAREVPYRATGKSWTLDVAEAGASGPRAMLDAFLHEIRAVRLEQVEMARLGLRLTDEEYAAAPPIA